MLSGSSLPFPSKGVWDESHKPARKDNSFSWKYHKMLSLSLTASSPQNALLLLVGFPFSPRHRIVLILLNSQPLCLFYPRTEHRRNDRLPDKEGKLLRSTNNAVPFGWWISGKCKGLFPPPNWKAWIWMMDNCSLSRNTFKSCFMENCLTLPQTPASIQCNLVFSHWKEICTEGESSLLPLLSRYQCVWPI